MNFVALQTGLVLSLIAYYVFAYIEDRRVQDEREEMIRLRTHEFVRRVSGWAIVALTGLYIYDREQPGILFLFVMVLASLYSEMAGRLYWRRRL